MTGGPALPDRYRPFVRAFDAAAPSYDDDYGPANAIMTAFRERSLAVLDATLPRSGLLLELGCGTGVEAAALAERSPERRLVATDLSWAMLAEAQRRAGAAGLAGRIAFRRMPAAAAGELAAPHGPGAFAGAYSSFGALNCEPDLRPVAAGLAALLPPGAPLVVSVMGRWPLWEFVWYLAHLQPARATRRWRPAGPRRSEAAAGSELPALPVRYYTPSGLARELAPWFRPERCEGMGVALPPPYLAPWLERRPWLAGALRRWEARWRAAGPAPWLGDHLLMVLRRSSALDAGGVWPRTILGTSPR